MKKVVRTVCIGALSGLAFLAACCSSKMAAVYGSPEIIANYGAETARLRYELDSINNRLEGNVDMETSKKRYQLQQRIADLQTALQRREGACVYGSPEVMEKYGQETNRMRQELKEAQTELKALDN